MTHKGRVFGLLPSPPPSYPSSVFRVRFSFQGPVPFTYAPGWWIIPSEVSPRPLAPLWLSAQANQPLCAHLPQPLPQPCLPAGGLITPRLKAGPFTQVQTPRGSGRSHDWDRNQKPARLLSTKCIVLARPARAQLFCEWLSAWTAFVEGIAFWWVHLFIHLFLECQLPPSLYPRETELL